MTTADVDPLAVELERTFDRLWPICRSILGPGFRESLDVLSELVPFERLRFATGEEVHDWVVPDEWRPRAARLVAPDGSVRADFADNNLHLVGYSEPFAGSMDLEELRPHLHSLPEQPGAIPYVTSYYQRRWGFCLTHDELAALPAGRYDVLVDTELVPGNLVVGEAVLPGTSTDEVLLSTYLCHPSLANNELSGPLVLSYLYRALAAWPERRLTFRFVVVPETIGAIAYLSRRGGHLSEHLVAGYQITCIGDGGPFTYKHSRREGTLADRAAMAVLGPTPALRVRRFDPAVGSDERQWCSPGYDLPVGSVMRTMYSEYPEYHTSLDDKSLMDFGAMAEAVAALERIAAVLDQNVRWRNDAPYGEPQLGRRGLFRTLSTLDRDAEELATWWVLNFADGEHDVLAIAERSGLDPLLLARVARSIASTGLLVPV